MIQYILNNSLLGGYMSSEIEQYWIETLAAFAVTEPVDLKKRNSTFNTQIYSLMAILAKYYATDEQVKEAASLSETNAEMLKMKLKYAGNARRVRYKLSKAEIVNVPEGDAPTIVKQDWVGVTLPVVHVPKGKFKEVDFLSGKDTPLRDAVVTLAIPALFELEKKSPEAANWFMNNFTMGIFSFGENEVKIVESLKK